MRMSDWSSDVCSSDLRACPNSMVSPTFVPDLCHAALDLLLDGETGIWHLANAGALSWHEFATKVADGAGYDTSLVLPMPVVKRSNTSLISTRGTILRSFDQALDAFLGDLDRVGLTASVIAAESPCLSYACKFEVDSTACREKGI